MNNEKVKDIERVICAAIWYGGDEDLTHGPYGTGRGVVLCGHRHHQIIELYHSLTGKPTREQGTCQGFLTSFNRFVSRKEANKVALAAGQVKEIISHFTSEELY